jgi:biotin carboxyl carrier protein
MEFHYEWAEGSRTVRVSGLKGRYSVNVGERTYEVIVLRADGARLDLLIDGRPVPAVAVRDGERREVKLGDRDRVVFSRVPGGRRPARTPAGGDDSLTASMHAQVAAVLVKAGDLVKLGMTLVILEAMKMELRIVAPYGGRVLRVDCSPGEVVERGRVLVELEPEPPPGPRG